MNKFNRVVLLSLLLITALLGCSELDETQKKDTEIFPSSDKFWVSRGEFVANKMEKLYPPFDTEVVKLIPEGKKVKKDEVVCELSPKERLEELVAKKAETEQKELQFKKSEFALNNVKNIENNKLDVAKLNVEKSLVELNKAKRLRDWTKIVELKASVITETLNRDLIKKRLESNRAMVKRGFSSKLEELRQEKDLFVAELTLAYTKKLLSYLLKHVDEKKVVVAKQQYESDKAAYLVAEKEYAKNVNDADINLQISVREKSDSEKRYLKLKSEVASLTVRAEAPGMMLWGKTYTGSAWAKLYEGAKVWPGICFMKRISGEKRSVEFYIDQSESNKLQKGEKVVFIPDSYPELRLIAAVNFISPVALSLPNAGNDVICKLKVKALFSDYSDKLSLGNSGTVIPFESLKNVKSNGNKVKLFFRSLSRKVSTTGDIKPSVAINIIAPFRGKLKSIGEEGQQVKKGDDIAAMKSDEVEQKLSDVSVELQKKEEELELQKKKNEIEKEKLKKMVTVKAGALKVAELEHAALLKRRDEDKIIKLQKDVELINEKISLGKEKLNHIKELKKKGLRSELEVLEAQYEIAQNVKSKTITTNDLEYEESGPTKSQIAISEIKVKTARLEYEKAILDRDMNLFNNDLNCKILQLDIKTKSDDKEHKEKMVKAAVLKSPIDGAIVLPEVHKNGGMRGKAEVGDEVSNFIPFMQVAKMDSLQVYTNVSEMDEKFIKIGQEVKISLEAFPGKSFKGWVKEKGIIAQTDFKKRQEAVFEVVIALKSKEHGNNKIPKEFKPGATCEVEFSLYNLDKALVVPYDCLVADASNTYVITEDGQKKKVEILFSDGLNGFPVKSGLNDGDVIIQQGGFL